MRVFDAAGDVLLGRYNCGETDAQAVDEGNVKAASASGPAGASCQLIVWTSEKSCQSNDVHANSAGLAISSKGAITF